MRQYLFRDDIGCSPQYTAYDIYNGIVHTLDQESYLTLSAKYKNLKYKNKNILDKSVLRKTDVPITNSPLKAEVHLTSKCNLSCAHCFQSASPSNLKYDVLKPSQWTKIFNKLEASGINRITLSGGEVLFYDGINEILEDLVKRMFRVELLTNGLLINERNVQLLSQPNIACSISLDGANDINHDRIRGKGTYKKLLKVFELISKNNVDFNIAVTVNKYNYQEIKQLYDIACKFNATSISFTFVEIQGRAQENDMGLDNEEYQQALELIKEIKNSKKPIVYCREQRIATMNLVNTNSLNANRSIYCKGGTQQLAIRSDGKTFPCIHAFENDDFMIGNILKEDLYRIWNSDKLNILRGEIKLKDINVCKSCSNSAKCGDKLSCRIRAYNETGNIYAHNSCI